MTSDFPNGRRWNDREPPPELAAAIHERLASERFEPFDDRSPPRFDSRAKTEFLRRTIARAFSERALRRVHGLRQMEELLAKQEAGGSIGLAGFLLGSIAKAFPISHSAMRRELRGREARGFVELAEQIELRYRVQPHRGHVFLRDPQQGPKQSSNEK